MDCSNKRPRRERVLVVPHADGHLEVFGSENVIVRIERLPVTNSRDAEAIAEDFLERSLPPIWRELYFPGMRRATGTAQLLLPSTIRRATDIEQSLQSLNSVLESLKQEEASAWMTV